MSDVLSGVRVVEVAQWWFVPAAGAVLSDWGADVLKIDAQFGWHKSLEGLKHLYDDGKVAIVHGVGYDQPSFSHFTSMSFWHTAAPNSGNEYGWVGRTAAELDPAGARTNMIVNVSDSQTLAVKAAKHVPLVFIDPAKFQQIARGAKENWMYGRRTFLLPALGLAALVLSACGGSTEAFQMLMLEHLDNLADASARAISNIKFDKVVVWENGGNNGRSSTADFLSGMAKTLPPMMQVMRDIGGIELPESLVRLGADDKERSASPVASNGPAPPKDKAKA